MNSTSVCGSAPPKTAESYLRAVPLNGILNNNCQRPAADFGINGQVFHRIAFSEIKVLINPAGGGEKTEGFNIEFFDGPTTFRKINSGILAPVESAAIEKIRYDVTGSQKSPSCIYQESRTIDGGYVDSVLAD
jgi:hypothetical protein